MGRSRYSLDQIKEILRHGGCELIDGSYVDQDTPFQYKCECGTESGITIKMFLLGTRCTNCTDTDKSRKHKYSVDDIKNIVRAGCCEFLGDSYKNATTPFPYKCECGNVSKITLNSFLGGGRCQDCANQKRRESHRFSVDHVKEIVRAGGCEFIDTEYVNSSTPFLFRCSCGNPGKISLAHFLRNHRCRDCGSKKMAEAQKNSLEYVAELVAKNGHTLISKEYKSYKRGKCGRHAKALLGNITRYACLKCSSERRVRENNGNWNPDRDEVKRLKDRGDAQRVWSKAVMRRDDYTCACCGVRGGKLHAHHINGYEWCVERRFDITNGVTMCTKCHRELHTLFGLKKIRFKHYVDFLKYKRGIEVVTKHSK